MAAPDLGEDRWRPARDAAAGFIIEGEQRIWEAYADGLDSWLDGVRRNVFSGRGLARIVDPLGIFALGQRFARMLVDPVVEAVRWIIGGAFARAGLPDVAFSARPWVANHLATVGNYLANTPDWLFDQIRTDLQAGIESGASIPALAEQVEARLLRGDADVWRDRGTVVARTEALSAYNGGTDEAMAVLSRELGVQLEKIWLASMDTRTRETHLLADGQRVPMGVPFIVGGYPAMVPGDEQLPPEERIQCRCSVLYVEPGEDVPLNNRGMRGGRDAPGRGR